MYSFDRLLILSPLASLAVTEVSNAWLARKLERSYRFHKSSLGLIFFRSAPYLIIGFLPVGLGLYLNNQYLMEFSLFMFYALFLPSLAISFPAASLIQATYEMYNLLLVRELFRTPTLSKALTIYFGLLAISLVISVNTALTHSGRMPNPYNEILTLFTALFVLSGLIHVSL